MCSIYPFKYCIHDYLVSFAERYVLFIMLNTFFPYTFVYQNSSKSIQHLHAYRILKREDTCVTFDGKNCSIKKQTFTSGEQASSYSRSPQTAKMLLVDNRRLVGNTPTVSNMTTGLSVDSSSGSQISILEHSVSAPLATYI